MKTVCLFIILKEVELEVFKGVELEAFMFLSDSF